MANGFVTVRPTERHGDAAFNLIGGIPVGCAFKFTTPGSGRLNISEIGAWMQCDAGAYGTVKFGIFAHNDAADAAQEYSAGGLVANSESSEYQVTSEEWTIIKHEYSTEPLLTAGLPYWLCFHAYDVTMFNNIEVSQYLTGGRKIYNAQAKADGWPSDWADGNFSTNDVGAYAVYAQGLPTYMEAMHQVAMGFNEMNGGMQ